MTGPAGARITVTLDNIPLGEALRYVANQAGLKVKVEPYAVAVIPLSEQSNDLITKRYHVPPEFFGGPLDVGYYLGSNLAGGWPNWSWHGYRSSEAPPVATNVIEKEAVSLQIGFRSRNRRRSRARQSGKGTTSTRQTFSMIVSSSGEPTPKQCCKAWASRFRAEQAQLSGHIVAR